MDEPIASLNNRDAQREKRYQRLQTSYPGIDDDSTSSFLFNEAKERANLKFDAIKAIEAKATAQIGAVLGIGFFSALAQKSTLSQALMVAIGLLVACIIANAAALWPRRYSLPSLETYNDDQIIAHNYKAKIQFELTEKYLKYGRTLSGISDTKGLFYRAASILLLLGVICFIYSLALVAPVAH